MFEGVPGGATEDAVVGWAQVDFYGVDITAEAGCLGCSCTEYDGVFSVARGL